MSRTLLIAAAFLGVGMVFALLASREGDSGGSSESGVAISVFAASSLTDAFREAGRAFEAANERTAVKFNFGSSSALAVQINEGAPADVFASADLPQMAVVERGAGVEAVVAPFATNRLVVVAPPREGPVNTLADLAKPGVRLVIAQRDVPVGRYAREVLGKLEATNGFGSTYERDVLTNVRSEEANVKAVLGKVQLGEADAALVYATDGAAAGRDLRIIAIPDAANVAAEYAIGVVATTGNRATAQAFVAFLVSAEGQAILRKWGFGEGRR